LITSGNVLVHNDDSNWRNVGEQTRSVALGPEQVTVRQTQLYSPSGKLLVWRWYRLATKDTTSPYVAKTILAKRKLLGHGDEGAEIVIAARYEDKPGEAVPVLESFLNDIMPAIRKGLAHAPAH
jgi:EpsI family protein